MEQLNEAIRLTRKGWVIHPLSSPKDNGGSPGKRPLLNSWQKRRKATEAELKEWFEKTDNNIGLVLGKESGIIVIDFDKPDWVDVLFPPEQKILERTLKAGRVTGRGQQYKWVLPEGAYLETFELPELPDAVIERFALLKSLEAKMRGCRTCFKWVINQSRDAMHGKEGRRLMLATAAELKARNVTLDELRLYARRVYGDKYDPKRTAEEWKNVDEKKTWRCDTIQEKYPEDYPEVKICRILFMKCCWRLRLLTSIKGREMLMEQ